MAVLGETTKDNLFKKLKEKPEDFFAFLLSQGFTEEWNLFWLIFYFRNYPVLLAKSLVRQQEKKLRKYFLEQAISFHFSNSMIFKELLCA